MSTACVAVVDDEAPVRVALRRLLLLANYDVVVFGSGEDFLASLAAKQPDCVVLDLQMPGLTGFDVQTRLREGATGIPVIFITASDAASLSQEAAQAGAVELLRKPFSSAALLACVDTALRHRPLVGTGVRE